MATQVPPDLKQAQAAILGAVSKNAGSLYWIGILLIVLGTIGIFGQVLFSFISIGIIGTFAVVGGVLQGMHAMQAKGWKSVTSQWLFAIFYVVVGILAWFYPIPALEGLTIWLAATFFATGILRLIQAFHHRVFREWFWLLLSSVLSIFVGFLIMQGWPSTSLWVPGMLMAVEFLLQGWTLLFLGMAAKSAGNK